MLLKDHQDHLRNFEATKEAFKIRKVVLKGFQDHLRNNPEDRERGSMFCLVVANAFNDGLRDWPGQDTTAKLLSFKPTGNHV